MWIKREIQDILPQIQGQYPVCVVTGSRQVGKTSLLQATLPNIPYMSLDLPFDAERAETTSQLFLEQLGTPCLIDEVQYAPSLFRHIKAHVDRAKPKKGLFFLTGSERFQLMEGVSESLAGRASILELFTLSHSELETWSGRRSTSSQLLEWILQGGYPALYADAIPRARFYSNLVATYIERDVRRLINVQNTRDFDRFLRLLAMRTSQLLSMNSLAAEIGVSQTTIKSWIQVLLSSGIVRFLEPWFTNLSKRLVKTPKLYFMDTGLCCYLMGLGGVEELAKSNLLGALFETHVFGQLVRAFANRGLSPQINFYRTHDGHEVDFLLQRGTQFDLLESKWAEHPHFDFKGRDSFQTLMPNSVRSFSMISSTRDDICRDQKLQLWIRNSIDWRHLFAGRDLDLDQKL